jgi:hypothetical protein
MRRLRVLARFLSLGSALALLTLPHQQGAYANADTPNGDNFTINGEKKAARG